MRVVVVISCLLACVRPARACEEDCSQDIKDANGCCPVTVAPSADRILTAALGGRAPTRLPNGTTDQMALLVAIAAVAPLRPRAVDPPTLSQGLSALARWEEEFGSTPALRKANVWARRGVDTLCGSAVLARDLWSAPLTEPELTCVELRVRGAFLRPPEDQLDLAALSTLATQARACRETPVAQREVAATAGALTAEDIACLEAQIRYARPSEQDKASRIRIVDAQARGDVSETLRLMRRHLDDITRSDPVLCIVYARLLLQVDPQSAADAYRWAGYAVERVTFGDWQRHVRGEALEVRAQAALHRWREADEAFIRERTEEHEDESAELREQAIADVLEWLQWVREAGVDTRWARAACLSVAGGRARCEP